MTAQSQDEKPAKEAQGRKALPVPKPNDLCTQPLQVFWKRHHTIFDFFFFGIQLATRMDKQRVIAAKALAHAGSAEDVQRWSDVQQDQDHTFKRLQTFGAFQSENLCIRLSDNFVCYLSEIIQACMLKRPELLRSSEVVKLEDVLRFSAYKDLIPYLVDRKLNELTYAGLRGINTFLIERTGLELGATEDERSLLNVLVELRNIYTHNRGVVSETFHRRMNKVSHSFNFTVGKRFHADFDTILDLANNSYVVATHLDREIAQKFRLQRRKFHVWDASA